MAKYIKVRDKRKNLFGIKIEGHKDWYVAPMFEQLGIGEWANETDGTWFKQNGRYGYYSIAERRVVIPALYGYPLFFNSKGHALTWKDYKAGVINKEGETVIPFIHDDCEFYNNEQKSQRHKPVYDNKEVETMTLEELEDRIRKEYILLLELGYEHHKKWVLSNEHREKIEEQEQKVRSLVWDRRQMMDSTWVHNLENAKRIGRTNRLLMRAVSKAIKLGKKTSKSLQWLEKVSNTAHYEVEVYVHPEWQDSKSDLRYERMYNSPAKEKDRLMDE